MLEIKDVSKLFKGGHRALSNVSFNLQSSELAFLTGHSGAGKSTLLKIIALLQRPSHGKIFFNNIALNQLGTKKIPFYRRQLGLIFQTPNLLHDRTTFHNVALPLMVMGYRYRDIARNVRAALDKVSLLNKEKNLPQQLSDGEKQRVNIARAIVHKPLMLLADEPTGNLDPELSLDIMQVFIDLHHVGVSSLIASHDLSLIEQLKYRKLVLKHGMLQ